MEIAGYIARAISTKNPEILGPFIVQTLCILVAPALIAASIYMLLGRLIVAYGAESLSLIRPSWMTKIFVIGDILSFIIQCMGAGMLSSTSNPGLGKTIILIGLALQLVFFGLFILTTAVFHVRMNKRPTSSMVNSQQHEKRGGWRLLIPILYVVSVLIFIRSVFRLVEYAGGNDGFLLSHEVFLYIFDSLLIFAAAGLLCIYYPAQMLPRKEDVGPEVGLC